MKDIIKYIPMIIPVGIAIGATSMRIEKVECDTKDLKEEQRILRERLFDIHEKVNEIYKNICNIK
jgi:hypothetical protein